MFPRVTVVNRTRPIMLPKKVLVPLPVPERPFKMIGVDFITCLPTTARVFDAVCVIVCHFTKLAHFIPCHTTITPKFAALFVKHVFRHHGFPMHIVSDREDQFLAQFWNQMCTDFGITQRRTSSHQPSTDGQVKRINKVLEEVYVLTSMT